MTKTTQTATVQCARNSGAGDFIELCRLTFEFTRVRRRRSRRSTGTCTALVDTRLQALALLEDGRREVAQRRVQALLVVERDVAAQGLPQLLVVGRRSCRTAPRSSSSGRTTPCARCRSSCRAGSCSARCPGVRAVACTRRRRTRCPGRCGTPGPAPVIDCAPIGATPALVSAASRRRLKAPADDAPRVTVHDDGQVAPLPGHLAGRSRRPPRLGWALAAASSRCRCGTLAKNARWPTLARRYRRALRPCRPASRISRATRRRPTARPRDRSCPVTRGLP